MTAVLRNGRGQDRRSLAAGVGGLLAFAILTALVQARLLLGLDVRVALAMVNLVSEPLDLAGGVMSLLFSGEISLAIALATAGLLWMRGRGVWSATPLAFLVPNGIELVMKLVVDQPTVPAILHRAVYYPLTSLSLAGSFPSGHAMRAGFLCFFLMSLVVAWGGRWRVPAVVILLLVSGVSAFTRVYLGDHWMSDSIGGLLLGASTAILVVGPVVGRPGSVQPACAVNDVDGETLEFDVRRR